MRVLTLLLAGLHISTAFAAGLAGAYERIYFYQIYEMENLVWGVNRGYIGGSCNGSGAGGRCTFNEFVNFISSGTVSNDPDIIQGNGAFDPRDTDAIANDVFAQGMGGRNINIIVQNLVNTQTVTHRPGYTGIWRGVAPHAIQQVRTQAATANTDISSHIDEASYTLKAVRRLRVKDHFPLLLQHLQSRVPEVNWQTTPVTHGGDSWDTIDWFTTMDQHPDLRNLNSDLSKKVMLEVWKFNTDDPTGPTHDQDRPFRNQQHQTVIVNIDNNINSCLN